MNPYIVDRGNLRYNPRYDAAALDKMAEDGAKAWADVPDAAAWQRELRGNARSGPARLDMIHAFYSDGMTVDRTASLLTAGWLAVEAVAMVLALVRARIGRRK